MVKGLQPKKTGRLEIEAARFSIQTLCIGTMRIYYHFR